MNPAEEEWMECEECGENLESVNPRVLSEGRGTKDLCDDCARCFTLESHHV